MNTKYDDYEFNFNYKEKSWASQSTIDRSIQIKDP
jgi:hypothetical protein